ncbi:Smr/MutS family protein [uncultured Xylophilus sp.]|uniref:Smr/MutS family protein n=1 Tax=uncultured Xylophilus sp. TaxID=296832 RepID=UPI0025D2846A|nr:Smr/MutS family protein [uncultured Xylophilus sp.]
MTAGDALTARSLQDLQAIRRALAERAAQAAAAEARRRAAEERRQAEQQMFARAVGPVQPLPDRRRAALAPEPPPPIPVQRQLDEQRVLLESISDDFDVSTLLDTDDQLSFRRPGVNVDVTQRLRRGDWSIQRQLDLHGLRTDEAREALAAFIRECHKQGLRCLRVVHGKGLGSPGRTPVLKSRVQSWLVQKNEVLAFVQARPLEGGAGALVVLLRPVSRYGG